MNRESKKIRNKRIRCAGAACMLIVILLCGCEEQEITKTVPLSNETEEEAEGIDVKNIQEYIYEGNVIDITWSEEAAGKLCLIKGLENRGILQWVDVYQKTVSEEIVFEESMIGYVKTAPGGRFIAYEHEAEEFRELIVYEVESGEKEAVMTWNDWSTIYRMEWSDDGTKLLVWTDIEESGENQDIGGERIMYCYDMESEEKLSSQVRIPVNGKMWRGMYPNEDASRVFIDEEYYTEEYDWGEENTEFENEELEGDGEDYISELKAKEKNWLVDMETKEVREVDIARTNIGIPIKYTKRGLFGIDEGKLWLAREPLGQVSGKRLLETKEEDVCICENGDHIFLIEKEEGTGYLQVTGILLEDGEIKEYQVLYKGVDGNFEMPFFKTFIGKDDHELVICSIEHDLWHMNMKVLEY